MKRNIIISGKQGSGKSHIAQAIKITHEVVYSTSPGVFLYEIRRPEFTDKLQKAQLIVIEECTRLYIDIIRKHLENIENNQNLPSIIFITQDSVSTKMKDFEQFHVINCNNDIF